VQIVATVIVAWFVVRTLVAQWSEVRRQPLTIHLDWRYIVAASVVVLAAYVVLIEAWRRILVSLKASLGFWTAARIVSVSKLGLYVPGKVWQVTAMVAMAKRANVDPAAAAGSALLNTIVNIAMGFLVALAAGWRSFDQVSQGRTQLGVVLLVLVLGSILLLPTMLPRILDAAGRLTRRTFSIATLPHRAVYVAIVANIIAWLLYGAAFELFVRGVSGSAPGAYPDYVTAWAWPYLVGYLAIVVPGGLGFREGALAVTLASLHLAAPQTAAVIAITSRLWLSVLELVPGLLFYVRAGGSRSQGLPPTP
jgi:hypothetical protein